MHKDAIADNMELELEKERNEQKEPALPSRCRSCSDLSICDLDFCLHWWH